MKRFVLLVALLVGISSFGYAGACATATMAVYDASGFSCTIGDLTFTNFSYTPSGTSPLDTAVTVTPVDIPSGIGFEFNASWEVTPGTTSDTNIGYTITAPSATITDLHMSVGSFGTDSTGVISITETASNGVTLFFQASNGQVLVNNVDATFTPVVSLHLAKDIGLNGNDGSASLSDLVNTTTQTPVPEPATLTLLGTGLLSMAGVLRRKLKK